MNKGLYIHIPFCTHLCSYCDFTKLYYNENIVDKYLDELEKELLSYHIQNITSIYLGGGTPSSLNLVQLEKLLKMVSLYKKGNISFTLEANIENLDEEKIKLLKKYGINRVSLGVQTFHDKLLKVINRHHHKEDVYRVISLLKEYDINDINIDLIYGLPGQNLNILKSDLDIAMELPITHISTYSLMVNEHTEFFNKGVQEKGDDEVREMYDYIYSYLKEHGFERYEVSNFAKEGYESKHNLIYWHNEEYYGIGLGASGYLHGKRYTNTKSINNYLDGKRIAESEDVSEEDKCFYQVMLGLRLKEGVEIPKRYMDKVPSLEKRKLLEKTPEGKYKVTDDNLFILDFILKELLF